MEDIIRKNKIYILISIITAIFFFGTAALCNQGAEVGDEEIKTADEVESEVIEEEDSETKEPEEEVFKEEEPIEEETTEEKEGSEEEIPETEEQKEALTIALEVYKGPSYSSADNVCYYRVKATVTGNPTPDVEFSRDDSNGAWGDNIAQVNLNNPQDTYTLTATATNSKGSASDSIELEWGCNKPPEISSIIINNEKKLYAGEIYDIFAEASDPEGENLQYRWNVNGGKIDTPTLNPTKWTTPANAGEYQLEVEVEDGSGGRTTMSKTVIIGKQLVLETSIQLYPVDSEGGFIRNNEQVHSGNTFYTGDSITNHHCKGFISFDISNLAGFNIEDADLYLDNHQVFDNPSFFKIFTISSVNWGSSLDLSDYDISGVIIDSYSVSSGPDYLCSSNILRTELQNAIDSDRSRFQIVINMNSSTSDGDGAWDGYEYRSYSTRLDIEYSN